MDKNRWFSTTSDNLKTLALPENCNVTSENFEELLSLFQIQIVDKFVPAFGEKNPLKEYSLQAKLLSIFPYLVAIVAKRTYENFDKEYDRLEHLIGQTEFFNAHEIKLTFTHQSEVIEGPSLNVFREKNKLYFKGKWASPLTMFALVPELSELLDTTGFNDELRLLLQLSPEEIRDWMTDQGFDLSEDRFQRKPGRVFIDQVNNDPPVAFDNEPAFSENTYSKERTPGKDSFAVTFSPKDFNTLVIPVSTKTYSATDFTEERSDFLHITEQEVREDIGIWSEEFVYEFLIRNSDRYSTVVWKNKEEESGKPYDFMFVENGTEKFIDVKGTPSGNKDIIYLSSFEWTFMFEKAEQYAIYRVYHAGTIEAKIEIIENPSELLMKGKIFPNPITLQV